MKSVCILLASFLAVAPIGCSKDQVSPDQPVSANTDRPAGTDTGNIAPSRSAPNRETEPPRVDSRKPDNRTFENRTEVERRPVAKARETVEVPEATVLTVVLLDPLTSETNRAGDSFTATLAEPIVVNSRVLAEKGDKVTGEVKNAEEPGRVKGRARLELVLKELTVGGQKYKLSTEPFTAVAGDTKDRDAGIIAGGAGVGAIVGAVTGGKKGAAVGAIIGGGTGTTAVLVTKGKQAELEPETRINFVLSGDVTLPVIRPASI
jgi:hypothetical protein